MRRITGRVQRPDGTAVALKYVYFILTDMYGRFVNSYTYGIDGQARVATTAKVLTDENGMFEIDVIENDAMEDETAYLVRVEDDAVKDFMVIVQAGTGEIDWVDLMKYGSPRQEGFNGIIYVSYPTINGVGYRFDCDMTERVVDYLGGGTNEDNASIVPEFAKYFAAHEDGIWFRDDMAAFDALLTKMVIENKTCKEAQGG